MTLAEIAPQRTYNPETKAWEGEHAFIAGITGFGKSFLVKRLAATRRFVVIHDPKNEIHIPGYKRVDSFEKLQRLDAKKYPKTIYAPKASELKDEAIQDRFFRWVFENGNRTVILDELNFLASSRHDCPPYLFECYVRGRTRGIEIWAITQEPVWIPKVCKTQTKHRYCFYVGDEAHQKVMASMLPAIAGTTRESVAAIANLEKKLFFYYRLGEKRARGPYFLDVRDEVKAA